MPWNLDRRRSEQIVPVDDSPPAMAGRAGRPGAASRAAARFGCRRRGDQSLEGDAVANIARRSTGHGDPARAGAGGGGGEEPARHIARDVDAQPWLDEVTASAVAGMYVDPEAGQVTLSACYAPWATRPTWFSPTSETSRANPGRVSTPAAECPRSSSITSTRDRAQPSATARSTSPYYSLVDSPCSTS